MFERLLKKWRERKNGKAARKVPRRAVPRRPLLEALEERWAPAVTYDWLGVTSNWNSGANWKSEADGSTGTVPSASDTAKLFGARPKDPEVQSGDSLAVGFLKLDSSFNGTHTLTVTGTLKDVSMTWNQPATLLVNGKLGLSVSST